MANYNHYRDEDRYDAFERARRSRNDQERPLQNRSFGPGASSYENEARGSRAGSLYGRPDRRSEGGRDMAGRQGGADRGDYRSDRGPRHGLDRSDFGPGNMDQYEDQDSYSGRQQRNRSHASLDEYGRSYGPVDAYHDQHAGRMRGMSLGTRSASTSNAEYEGFNSSRRGSLPQRDQDRYGSAYWGRHEHNERSSAGSYGRGANYDQPDGYRGRSAYDHDRYNESRDQSRGLRSTRNMSSSHSGRDDAAYGSAYGSYDPTLYGPSTDYDNDTGSRYDEPYGRRDDRRGR
ncbi:hypothetical protein GCM10027048_30720 [Hymenobacter coalescens]